jgi:hypothetical protein
MIAEAARQQKFDETVRFYSGLVDAPVLGRWYASRARELGGSWPLQQQARPCRRSGAVPKAEEELVAAGRARPEPRAAGRRTFLAARRAARRR